MDGSTNGFFNGTDSPFDLWDMVISGADGKVNIRECRLNRVEFTVGIDFEWGEPAGSVEGKVGCKA
jgi:hypothetical protein